MSERILPADLQPAIFRRLLGLHQEVEHAAQFTDEQLAVVIWAASVMQAFNAYNVTCPKPLPEQGNAPLT